MLRLTNKRREEASVKRALTLENEIELIEGCRAGKDSARKELYTLYSKQMLAVCYRYTGDMDAAHFCTMALSKSSLVSRFAVNVHWARG